MNKTILNSAIFIVAFLLMYSFAYPFYNGGGLKVFPEKKSVTELQAENKELSDSYGIAKSLSQNTKSESAAFAGISQQEKDRINLAIPKEMDISRTINDINQLVKNTGLKMTDIKFTKNSNSSKTLSKLTVYQLNFSLEGEYPKFKTFLKSMENSLELYTVKSISLAESTGAEDAAGLFKYNMTVDAYETKN
jgi:Tfp pilus assembly protein PilO